MGGFFQDLPRVWRPQRPLPHDYLVAGATWFWKFSLRHFSPADGTVTFYLAGLTEQFDVAAVDSGDGATFQVKTAPAATENLPPGVYAWSAMMAVGAGYTGPDYVTGDQLQVGGGTIELLPNIAAIDSAYDGRSPVKQMLDAVTATLLSTLGRQEKSYQVHGLGGAGRVFEVTSRKELEDLRSRYQALYNLERQREGEVPANDHHITARFA